MVLAAALLHLLLSQPLAPGVRHETWKGPPGRYHVIRVAPWAQAKVRPAVAGKGRAPLTRLAHGGVAAINGGYFDKRSGATVSWVMRQGTVISNPQRNLGLMGNPRLWPYLGAIMARTEWRLLKSGGRFRWQIARHGTRPPTGWQLWHCLQAGPRLLPSPAIKAEAFWRQGKDAINSQGRAGRSGLGLTANGELLLVSSPNGQTLAQFRTILMGLQCRDAMALDGGSSAQLAWRDKKGWHVVGAGEPKRPGKLPHLVSALVVGP